MYMYSSHYVDTKPEIKHYRYRLTYASKGYSAWVEFWFGTWPSRATITAPGGQVLKDFRVSGRAGDINNSTSMPNY